MAHEQYLHIAKVLKNPQNSKMILIIIYLFRYKDFIEISY